MAIELMKVIARLVNPGEETYEDDFCLTSYNPEESEEYLEDCMPQQGVFYRKSVADGDPICVCKKEFIGFDFKPFSPDLEPSILAEYISNVGYEEAISPFRDDFTKMVKSKIQQESVTQAIIPTPGIIQSIPILTYIKKCSPPSTVTFTVLVDVKITCFQHWEGDYDEDVEFELIGVIDGSRLKEILIEACP